MEKYRNMVVAILRGTGSCNKAARIHGLSHHTVRRWRDLAWERELSADDIASLTDGQLKEIFEERPYRAAVKSNFYAEVIVLDGGQRFPMLIDRSTGLPDGFATDYSLAKHLRKPINTTRPAISAIAMFYEWAKDRGINLDERVDSMRLISSDEITSLAGYLWKDRRSSDGSSVGGSTHGSRIGAIKAYLKWRVQLVVSLLAVDDPKVVHGNTRLAATIEQMDSAAGRSVSKPRGILSEDQCRRLFEIVTPGSPENPFQRRTQLRNFVILLAYIELGIRRSEILTVKGSHTSIGPRSTLHVTFTPNDPADPRKDQPSLKTKSRLLPISRTLATSFDRLLKERRSNPATAAAAKRTAFVMLSTTTGKPLSIDAVDDIFVVLRQRFPEVFPSDFAPHHLRRSWNYSFSKSCAVSGLDKKLQDKLLRYLMGWTITSSQPSKYNQAFIEEQAFKILIGMQNTLTGAANE